MDSHDPLVRVIHRLLRDNIPAGVMDAAIEHARIHAEVPDNALGQLAAEYADRIAALSE